MPLGTLGKDPIVLQPWGAIEGTLLVAGQPAAEQGVTLGTAAAIEPEGTLTINAQANTTTDDNGRFRFPKVPAGPLVVCRYFNFNRDKIGPVGMSHNQEIILPAGGVAEVKLGGEGRMLLGRLALSRELKGHNWRDDLQVLTEAGQTQPRISARPNTPEWRRGLRELNRFWARQHKYYLEIEPDGAFRIADVPPGEYVLQLTVAEPFDPDAYDPAGNPIMRRTLGSLTRPVSVSASAAGEPLDLGSITVPLD